VRLTPLDDDNPLFSLHLTRQAAPMKDRHLRISIAAAACAAISLCEPAVGAPPTAPAALALRPVQSDVPYEQVPPEAVEKCSIRDLNVEGWTGWELLGPDGNLLRRFADTNNDKKVDLWCYYNFGVEVYRDIDRNHNGKADEYRWLGTAGVRWGLDEDEDGQVDRWKQISAEEVTSEVVAALRDHDGPRFARLLISESELKALGLGAEKTAQILAKSTRAASDFEDLAKRQTSVGDDAQWVQFAAPAPGLVPSGTEGSTDDVMVYENAVAMFEHGDKSGQLMVGTLIRVDEAWRLVELPSVGEGETVAQMAGNFFTPGGTPTASAESQTTINQDTQQAVAELESIETKLSAAKLPAEMAPLHQRRADLLEKLIANSENRVERDTWVRQLVDMLSMGAQTGGYPDAVQRLNRVAERFAGNDDALKAYADFQAISTEYVVRQTPDADFSEVQKWYLDALSQFVEQYPSTPESAQAWMQLALSKEFEDKEQDALVFYKRVVSTFPNTNAGEKAAGAVRRLESVGQSLELAGPTLDGKPFKLSSLRGRPVVVHYWATWCEPCKQDMKLLRRLQAAYQKAGLQVVGVNVDLTKEQAKAFLQQNPLPWTQLFEPGGLESSELAKALGVQTLPTMLLVDASGKVVKHNVRAAELDEKLAELLQRK
jgi:thiol-disulfide isomerase/thioredoxin